jgi:hypothetical protein
LIVFGVKKARFILTGMFCVKQRYIPPLIPAAAKRSVVMQHLGKEDTRYPPAPPGTQFVSASGTRNVLPPETDTQLVLPLPADMPSALPLAADIPSILPLEANTPSALLPETGPPLVVTRSGDKGLSKGSIAGICIASLLALSLCCAACVLLLVYMGRRRSKKQEGAGVESQASTLHVRPMSVRTKAVYITSSDTPLFHPYLQLEHLVRAETQITMPQLRA